MRKWQFLLLWSVGTFSLCVALSSETDVAENIQAAKAVIIPVRGVILPAKFGGQEEQLLAALKNAQTMSQIILDIDSPGGAVDSCDRIATALLQSRAPVTAVVRHQAVSGGAMLATACQKIFMVKGARIGDVQPMQAVGGEMDERTAEKIEADVRAIMAVNARQNNYPQLLLEAMVSRSFEIYEVQYTDQTREFLTAEEFNLRQEHNFDGKKLAAPPKIVTHKNKLLELTPQEAVEYGIAVKILDSFDDIYAELTLDRAAVLVADIPAGKFDPLKVVEDLQLSRGLVLLLAVFLLLGIAGTITEIHTPGFGIPGALGLIGFVCFFYLLASHQRATWLEMAVFVVGVILLVIEVVVLPGFGVCGIIGIILLLAGLTLAWLPDLSSNYLQMHLREEISVALLISLGAFVLVAVAFIWLINRGAKLPVSKRAFLETVLPDYQTAMHSAPVKDLEKSAADDLGNLKNREAVAVTDLRPAGKIRLADGEILDVISGGEFIEKNQTVKVIALTDAHIVVAKT